MAFPMEKPMEIVDFRLPCLMTPEMGCWMRPMDRWINFWGKPMGKAMGFKPRIDGKSPDNFDKHTHYGSWLDVGWTLLLVFRMKLFSFS